MKKKMRQTTGTQAWVLKLFVLVLVFGLAVSLQAQFKPHYTYYNFSFGARALGLGNAFTAVADDLSAVFWNPAGMAEFKFPEFYASYRKNSMTGVYDAQSNPSVDYTEAFNYNFESDLKNFDFLAVSVPAHFWDMKWTFGLSYYRLIPYSMKGEEVSRLTTDSLSYIGFKDTVTFMGEGGVDVLGFTAAYYFSDYFSLGVTMQQFFNSGTSDYHYVSDSVSYPHDYRRVTTEKIEGRNFILGMIFKPMEDVVVGMTYRTRLKDYFSSEYTQTDTVGAAGTSGSSRTRMVFPARLSAGVMVRLFPTVQLSADYSIYYWSLGSVANYFGATEDVEFPMTSASAYPQEDYQNFRMGLQVKVPYQRMVMFLRTGLFTEKALFSDSTGGTVKVTGYSFGVGANLSPMLSIDFGYMHQRSRWNENSYFLSSGTVFNRYRNNTVCLTATFRFMRGATPYR